MLSSANVVQSTPQQYVQNALEQSDNSIPVNTENVNIKNNEIKKAADNYNLIDRLEYKRADDYAALLDRGHVQLIGEGVIDITNIPKEFNVVVPYPKHSKYGLDKQYILLNPIAY